MILYVNGTPVKVTAESSLKNAGILTEEEFEALPSEEKNSGLWILPGVSSFPMVSGGSLDFSTEEKVIGRWIDGKPLYQKVCVVSMPTTGTYYDAGVENVDVLLSWYSGYLVDSSGTNVKPINYPEIKVRILDNRIECMNSLIAYQNFTLVSILLYTKTIDEGVIE